GTGKTSMLGALSRAIPESERIIVIEDTSELRLFQRHTIFLETQPATRKSQTDITVRELFRSSLRMRPDRIVVGEVRGGEALDLIQSMISGHEGSLSTVHASSAFDALVRLETLSLMSEIDIPIYVARSQVASAIDVVVQLTRSNETGRRRVSRISEVHRLNADNQYETSDLYGLKGVEPTASNSAPLPGSHLELTPTGTLPSFATEPFLHGMSEKIIDSTDMWKKS
ncbi:CpaF/VirB11 family protein, partial [bacterium]|nr:CpaF/VirB11 family protein [bacterium]